jgi:hypothetical protein
LSEKYRRIPLIGLYVVLAVCMLGCATHSFYLGRRTGIEATVTYLIEQGVLELDEESPTL